MSVLAEIRRQVDATPGIVSDNISMGENTEIITRVFLVLYLKVRKNLFFDIVIYTVLYRERSRERSDGKEKHQADYRHGKDRRVDLAAYLTEGEAVQLAEI